MLRCFDFKHDDLAVSWEECEIFKGLIVSNAMLGANLKTRFLNSNFMIFNLVSILGGLAPTSNEETVGQNAPKEATKIFLMF